MEASFDIYELQIYRENVDNSNLLQAPVEGARHPAFYNHCWFQGQWHGLGEIYITRYQLGISKLEFYVGNKIFIALA